MGQIKAIVNASYTFNDVVWYCWVTAMAVTVLCLAWYELDSDRRKMINNKGEQQ
jgi:hypothetical protein